MVKEYVGHMFGIDTVENYKAIQSGDWKDR